ncbi:signal transducer [Moniliophthora roreri]|uniref:Signal transducer n=1 Tax=Moniliophthora roreri TaxID=221103 RepID=A0A0W0EZQ9_MONRR|nr:signal transducer [Moniliophthora roreri]
MYHDHRSRPQISIPDTQLPPGARQPTNPSPSSRAFSPWAFELNPPPYPPPEAGYEQPQSLHNPWGDYDDDGHHYPHDPRIRDQSVISGVSMSRSTSLAASMNNVTPIPFPEPQIYRSVSQRAPSSNLNLSRPGHRPNRSEAQLEQLQREPSNTSVASRASSYYQPDDGAASSESHGEDEESISHSLSNLSLSSEDGIRRFQAGELAEKDQLWHRLVPPEAIEALGKSEVQRQSVIFEILKSEREYVSDLEAVQEVFITPLHRASPPIITPPEKLTGFIREVFGNFDQILSHHQRMLAALFARQRDQHPLIQSIADIVLDSTLKSDFRSAYETYIKHYPLSESHHRRELTNNPNYQRFVQSAGNDPRIRKRDLITFLSRPVTRLPRLNLLLEQSFKLTNKEFDHPDTETLPIILNILSDTIKSTQPGIEAAESKVKFWSLCESLGFKKGEIIDMDLYDSSRTLIYSGSVFRRGKSGHGWLEPMCALLDNYFLITTEEQHPNGVVRRNLMSRPLPLSYLRLGPFDSPVETRKERDKEGGTLSGLLYQTVTIYPFTIYHAATMERRYTLYVASEGIRKKWHEAFTHALAVHQARQEGNMFFDPQTLTHRFFRLVGTRHDNGRLITGRIDNAVPFSINGREFIVVGTPSGIYVSLRSEEKYRKALHHNSPTAIAAIQMLGNKTFNRLIVHVDSSLLCYSLDLLAQVALGRVDPKAMAHSFERVAAPDVNVIFFKHLEIGHRVLVLYASKKFLQTSLNLHVLEAIDTSEGDLTPKKRNGHAARSFRSFGEPGYVPKDAYDIAPLVKTVGILSSDGIVVIDPLNLSSSRVAVVPDWSDASNSAPMGKLKERLDDARPLALIRSNADELLAVYNTVGFYINKHGTPSRNSGCVKWEATASACAHRGGHILLFSSRFIEIRQILTGRLVQVIEAQDIRLLYSGSKADSDETILVAMRGEKNDQDGIMEKIVELKETKEIGIGTATPISAIPASVWEEWDM